MNHLRVGSMYKWYDTSNSMRWNYQMMIVLTGDVVYNFGGYAPASSNHTSYWDESLGSWEEV